MAVSLWAMGFAVLCPHCNTFLLGGAEGIPDETWLAGDKEMLRRCDLVVMVPGWSVSKGACAELLLANSLGIPAYNWETDRDQLVAWASEGKPTPYEERVSAAELDKQWLREEAMHVVEVIDAHLHRDGLLDRAASEYLLHHCEDMIALRKLGDRRQRPKEVPPAPQGLKACPKCGRQSFEWDYQRRLWRCLWKDCQQTSLEVKP